MIKISLLVEDQHIAEPDAFLSQVIQLLNAWGVNAKAIIPEACCLHMGRVRPTADLYLLASSTPLALSLAGMLHSLGAPLVNPYPVANALHNPLIGLRILQEQGLPVPETYVVASQEALRGLLGGGPLIIKPLEERGERAEYLIRDLYQFSALPPMAGPLLAQRCYEPCAESYLISCIGGQVISIIQQGTTPADEPTSARGSLAPDIAHDLALRCGQAFDSDLFGLKVRLHNGEPYVIEMRNFPNSSQGPEAEARLAEYLYARAQFLIEQKRESWQ